MLPTWSQATSQSSRDRELALRAALHDISHILTYLCRLTSILVARFQLDLQAAYRHSTGHDTAPGSDADAPGTRAGEPQRQKRRVLKEQTQVGVENEFAALSGTLLSVCS